MNKNDVELIKKIHAMYESAGFDDNGMQIVVGAFTIEMLRAGIQSDESRKHFERMYGLGSDLAEAFLAAVQGKSSGRYREPEWYDRYYTLHTAPELQPIHQECIKILYEQYKDVQNSTCSILDFGCGPGWFEKLLRAHGYEGWYTGIDTSVKAIEIARANSTHPFSEWKTVFPHAAVSADTDLCDLYLFIEVLEHLKDDIGTLSDVVPPYSSVVISVPTYDSAGHVRFFAESDDICSRYSIFDGGSYYKDRQIYAWGTYRP